MIGIRSKWRAEYIGRVWDLLDIEEQWLIVFGTRGDRLRPSVQLATIDALLDKGLIRVTAIGLEHKRLVPRRIRATRLGRELRTHARRQLRASAGGSSNGRSQSKVGRADRARSVQHIAALEPG